MQKQVSSGQPRPRPKETGPQCPAPIFGISYNRAHSMRNNNQISHW